MIKGISGGQRKRTSVGIELITNPSVLFLDEPTSGLDSYAAYNLVKLLNQFAKTNCTVLCTIHQPSSEVFVLFDQVIFLAQGKILYQGSIPDIDPHFRRQGFVCPSNYNPADYVMFLCTINLDDPTYDYNFC
jgi:ABC-type multidrug transport system ATPase subunit